MEPQSSLPYSQAPATCPYPEPSRSLPYPTSHFLKIRLNIIFPSIPGSPKWSLSHRFPHQNPVYTSPLPHTRYMPHPSHSSRCYHPHNIWWAVQVIQLLIMQFPPLPCYPFPLGPKYSHHPTSYFLKIHLNIIVPCTPGSPNSSPPYVLHVLSMWTFRNMVYFCGEELLVPRLTPKLEAHPLSAFRYRLFNRPAATLHIEGRSSIRNLRTRHAVVTRTHIHERR